jgi:hypothetical protein
MFIGGVVEAINNSANFFEDPSLNPNSVHNTILENNYV